MSKTILEIKNLTKRFPSVLAVDNACLEIEEGKIHSIVGGNGAGKSTLMKVLAGVYPYGSYEGDFMLEGKVCRYLSIVHAEENGISMVPQELNMVNEMTVADNLFINKQPKKFGIINQNKMIYEAEEILNNFDLKLNPLSLVKEIGIAQKQLIVIARAMHNNAKVLILDEPTATLSSEESKFLFRKIENLKKKGISSIYISHRLDEVRDISDSITIMRDSKVIETDSVNNMDEKRMVSLMVGKNIEDFYVERDRSPSEKVLEAKNISVYSVKIQDRKIVDDISFYVRKGEILSIYGLVGSGRTEMALGLIGAWKGKVSYELKVNGKNVINKSPHEALENGISLLPEDRKAEGAISRQSVMSNITASSLASYSKFGVIDSLEEKNTAQSLIDSMSIKTSGMNSNIETLSGGNQQKVILSRLIASNSSILILDEATQGVDIEAKTQIYKILDDLAKKGKAVVFISSDIEEVMGISDRIMIMKHGKTVITLDNDESLEKEKVLWYATVGNKE